MSGSASVHATHDGPLPNVKFCLQGGGGYAWALQPVRLFFWNGQQWVLYRHGRTGSDGCGTFFDVDGNRAYMVDGFRELRVPYTYSSGADVYRYIGGTPWGWVANQNITYQLPTGLVTGPHQLS